MLLNDLLDILEAFGGGRGGAPNDVAVRFLLPSFFWCVLALVALRQWQKKRARKDLYIGGAAMLGLSRELLMLAAEYGSLRGYLRFDSIYPFYPPFEHGATMLCSVIIGFAYLNNLHQGDRYTLRFLYIGSAATVLLYVVTAFSWPAYLSSHAGATFGSFPGDLAFRVTGALLMLSVLVMLANMARKESGRVPFTLYVPFLYFFLDDFLMIFNILSAERFVAIYAPIRHNLHIWAIPMLLALYWIDLTKSLSAAEKTINRVFHLSPSVLSIADFNGTITASSPACQQVLGYPPSELLGRNLRQFGYPDETDPEITPAATVSGQQPFDFISQYTRENDVPKWLNWNVQREEAEKKLYVVISDITEHKKLEDQLRLAQKLEAVGTLAGGIAHDFNNMLTTITGYAGLLQMEMVEDDPRKTMVDQILSASDRAANLTRSLLDYSRKQIRNPAVVELNRVVKGIEALLSRLIPESIELTCLLRKDDLTVWADVGQIEQVIMNLVTNARDAMSGRGKLLISTESAHVDGNHALAHGNGKPGSYALLAIADSGSGMDEKTLERIFEPFFTTKEVGKGSGLGLAMVYGIVKQHDGFIDVCSEPGKGTTFSIYLPLIDASALRPEIKEVLQPLGGTETILLIEDESVVRQLLKEVLVGSGYRVIEASDGAEGVETFMQHRDEIHLIITDVMMPRKSGREAFDEIRRSKEEIKAIFLSGYSAETAGEQLDHGMPFLAKPVSPRGLLATTRALLDS